MTLQETAQLLGSLGEFVGAIVVMVTLIYLAVQVRYSRMLLEESRKIAMGQISQTNAGFRLDLQRYLGQPHVAELRAKVEGGEQRYHEEQLQNFDALDPIEKLQWKAIAAQYAIMTDEGVYQSNLGLMGEEDKDIFEQQARSSMPYWKEFDSYIPSRLRRWYSDDEGQ